MRIPTGESAPPTVVIPCQSAIQAEFALPRLFTMTEILAMTGRKSYLQDTSPDHRTPRRTPLPAAPKNSAPADSGKSNDRHAAITDNLNSWTNYKRWAENIRSTWGSAEKP